VPNSSAVPDSLSEWCEIYKPMALITPDLDNSLGANWVASAASWPGSAGDRGSPGAANPPPGHSGFSRPGAVALMRVVASDGLLGHGEELWMAPGRLSFGQHAIILTATDSAGMSASAVIEITIVPEQFYLPVVYR